MQMQSTINIDPIIYSAIELGASTWLVAGKLPTSEKTGLHRLEAGNSRALLALIADLRKKVAVKFGVEAAVVSCFCASLTSKFRYARGQPCDEWQAMAKRPFVHKWTQHACAPLE
jgi:hypothetical protein